MEKIIPKQTFPDWMNKLEEFTIYAPVKKEESWSFEALTKPGEINIHYLNTAESPKKVVFPQREVLFEFNGSPNPKGRENVDLKEVPPEGKSQIVVGIRPCDARAVRLLDRVFEEDIEDPYYSRRRKATVLVGLGCDSPPSPNCFCTSVGGLPFARTDLDVLVTDLGNDYYVESLTGKGAELMKTAGKLFKEPKNGQRDKMEKIQADSARQIQRKIKKLDTKSSRLDKMFDSPFWEEEAAACIRCGICTYLCPSCHCFDITDEVNAVSPLSGKRVRNWDNCQFPDFTMHSSGHNPRPGKASRLRRRVLHKFHYFIKTYGDYLCTGCGRCVTKCPVGIDIVDIMNKVEVS